MIETQSIMIYHVILTGISHNFNLQTGPLKLQCIKKYNLSLYLLLLKYLISMFYTMNRIEVV